MGKAGKGVSVCFAQTLLKHTRADGNLLYTLKSSIMEEAELEVHDNDTDLSTNSATLTTVSSQFPKYAR